MVINKIIESIMIVIESAIEDKRLTIYAYIARRLNLEGFKYFYHINELKKISLYMDVSSEENWFFIFKSIDGLGKAAFALKSECELWKFYSSEYHIWHKYNAAYNISYHSCLDNIS